MDFNEYLNKAKKTAIFPEDKALEYLTLGLVGEAGEVANKVKKVLRDGRSREGIIDECSDVLWYLAMLVDELGEDFNAVAEHNIKKLASRQARNVLGGSGDER